MVGVRKTLLNLHFCRDNAVALASLPIAAMGLYLTITSQSEERAHKELLLRPDLNLNVRVHDYFVTVVNLGLGPALITDTLYYFEGQCGVVKSDEVVVPRKRPNKGRQLPAEDVEGRASPEGNSRPAAVVRTPSRATMSIRLAAVRRRARGFKPRAGRRSTRGRSPVR